MINNIYFSNNSFEQNKMPNIINFSEKSTNEKNNNQTLNHQLFFNFENFIQRVDKNSSNKKEESNNNTNMGIS